MTTWRRGAALVAAVLLVGCGGGGSSSGGGGSGGGGAGGGTGGGTGGGGSGGGTPAVSGIAVPKEISAVPTKSATSSALVRRRSASLELPATSDYVRAQSVKFVDERALSRFDILNTIFKAMEQTHYADAENVNQGAYGAMVSWEENRGDSVAKQLVPWVVDSRLVTVDGKTANRVRAWLKMRMGDEQELQTIKVQVDVFEAPVQRADGSYADYGVWRIDATVADPTRFFFSAAATRGADGVSTVALHQLDAHEGETRGILRRADGQGLGKVTFPDWSACTSPSCQPAPLTVAYVYDAAHVALKKGSAAAVFKDRSDVVDLVQRYGLYDAATGDDVSKSRSFGFPIRYADAQGNERYGYYGAWQGRHQIWAGDQSSLPAGTTVVRGDRGPGEAAETFTTGAPLTGTLVKRTLVAADVQDVKGLAVETWVNSQLSLQWKGSSWYSCVNPDHSQFPPVCGAGSGTFTDFASIAYNPSDTRRNVNVNAWDEQLRQPVNLVYRLDGPQGAGFYLASGGTNGPPTPTDTSWTPQLDAQLWVNVNGAIYIAFDGTGWVQKKLVSFDQSTWTPTFDPAGDAPYALELNREYYINNPGASYVVKRTGASTYDVKIELQTVANPTNAAAFAPAGTVFRPQWGGSGASTYRFVTSPSDPSFLKLVYASVGQDERTPGAAVGAVVTQGQWGLVAYDGAGNPLGLQFNWDYPQDGQSYGTQQYLLKADGTAKMLDDPIRLQPIQLTTAGGETKTYALQFDGSWVSGLPDLWNELRKTQFDVTPEIAAKVVSIPAGTIVADAADAAKRYVFKPLATSEYLKTIADPGNLDVAAAAALDLGTVPSYQPNDMGAPPAATLKYSEGKAVP